MDDPRFLTPELRRTNSGELVAIIDAIVGSRDMAKWVEIFRQADVIWAPVLSTVEVAHDAQMAANGVFAEIAPGLRTVNNPLNIAGVKKVQPVMAPQIGERGVKIVCHRRRCRQGLQSLYFAPFTARCTPSPPAPGGGG